MPIQPFRRCWHVYIRDTYSYTSTGLYDKDSKTWLQFSFEPTYANLILHGAFVKHICNDSGREVTNTSASELKNACNWYLKRHSVYFWVKFVYHFKREILFSGKQTGWKIVMTVD